MRIIVFALFAAAWATVAHGQTQMADPDFRPALARPAFAANGPVVVIDEAHRNFHTAEGRYKPLADLLRADGFVVRDGQTAFDRASLQRAQILIVANAGAASAAEAGTPAFTTAECDAVRDWVRDGGALLLVADHAPFGGAAADLAARFGVGMGKGWVFERAETSAGMTTQFTFDRVKSSLGDHPITRGRTADEQVSRVRAFTGQSLTPPAGAVVLMRLGETAREAPDNASLNAAAEAIARGDERAIAEFPSVAGRAQGLALTFGRGRVVVLGEAAMLSAQVVRFPQGDSRAEIRMGMNVPGTDNQQFALNIMRWLGGALE